MNATVDIYVPEDPWDKPFVVLSFSRRILLTLGLTYEQVSRLTDADMQRIADILQAQRFDHEFDEEVTFTARLVLAEKSAHPLSDQDDQTVETEP